VQLRLDFLDFALELLVGFLKVDRRRTWRQLLSVGRG
jgi:hypothetical protein